MTVLLNYQKRKNQILFKDLEQHKGIQLSNLQNYVPVYSQLFALNNNNYNSINLNHLWCIHRIKDSTHSDNENIFTCTIQNSESSDITFEQKVFFKMAPLLDPFKYVVGKYDYLDTNLFTLPSLENNTTVHPKLLDTNNSSYVDGFFVFLSSQVLNCKKFIHGIDYYGSFLAIKNNFKLNIIDDLDYLIKSEFFNKQTNILFQVEDFSHLIEYDSPSLIPIKIHSLSNKSSSNISAKSIHDEIFDNIFESTLEIPNHVNLTDLKDADIDLLDITNNNLLELNSNNNNNMTIKSGSTCSSRTSYTHTDDNDSQISDDGDVVSENSNSSNLDNSENISHNTSEFSDEDEEEKVHVTIPKFPVQVICMEKCENTFDDVILNHDLSKDEWFSAFMQIIMNLLTYQKLFSFTHNDLHTNNVMYNTTTSQFIYYVYNKKYYKVPTFGRIYKIIDFGRAIYKFNGKTFCSDSFQPGGDAATQYNTEPYFNENKPRLEPNYSFDLCRLACSIFDYIVDDFENLKQLEKKNPVVKLIVEWCLDDNGINVLYKNNGMERYPDFKLYKMIARFVHKHTPVAQLERPEFKKYIMKKTNLPKDAIVMNIDDM